jgi:hypothetical protein
MFANHMVSGMPKQVILVHRDHHRIGSDRPTSVQGYFHQEICSCTEPHGLRQQLQVITLWLCWALLLKLFSISFQHMSLMETVMILSRDYDSDAIFLFFLSSLLTVAPFRSPQTIVTYPFLLPLSSTSSLRLRQPLFSIRVLVPWGCPLYYT